MAQAITVTIDAEGNVKVEANGVTGSGCAALTKEIERALGTTTGDSKKPEWFNQTGANQNASNSAR
jgi:hypothetical protein